MATRAPSLIAPRVFARRKGLPDYGKNRIQFILDWQPQPLRPPRPTVDMEQIDLFSAFAVAQE